MADPTLVVHVRLRRVRLVLAVLAVLRWSPLRFFPGLAWRIVEWALSLAVLESRHGTKPWRRIGALRVERG